MPTVAEVLGCPSPYRGHTEFLCALECEVEQVMEHVGIHNMKGKADNSLREGGVEFVTINPSSRAFIMQNFKELYKTVKFQKGDPFSERTSTHVHINVSSLEQEKVKNIILLYALFEELFFYYVKPNRRDNIHCVPLTETHLPSIYNKSLDYCVASWHKYTALNLKRMMDLGTLEFRHMHGTNDATEVDTWLHILENLWKVGQAVQISRDTICDRNKISEWFDLIFFPSDKIMARKPELFSIIGNNLIDVKLSLIQGK